jgi:hypothetical protein
MLPLSLLSQSNRELAGSRRAGIEKYTEQDSRRKRVEESWRGEIELQRETRHKDEIEVLWLEDKEDDGLRATSRGEEKGDTLQYPEKDSRSELANVS